MDSSPNQVFCKIKALITENIKANGFGHQPHSDWEERVIQNWNLRSLCKDQQDPNLRDNARWDSPPVDWFKINFDETSKGNFGIAGYGIVIKNSYGEKVGCIAIPIGSQTIGSQTNHVAEACAALHGLIYAKSLNLRKVWV